MNYKSQPLERHEREEMRADDEVLPRILRSYRLMLDFYGMQLVSTETGLLARTEPEEKCMGRYRHLIRALSLRKERVEAEERVFFSQARNTTTCAYRAS